MVINKYIKRRIYSIIFCFILSTLLATAQSWQPISTQIPGETITGISSIITSPSIVATTLNDGIYRSIDSGDSWQHVFTTLDSIFSLVRLDGKHLCAGGKGFVYTSSDSGVTWTTNNFPFPIAISKLLFHPSGALLAATGSKWDNSGLGNGKGVWLSPDSGVTWSALNSGITMTDPLIESMAITPSGTILAGIFDTNVGLAGKFGIMKLDSLQGTWQRVSISVDAPFNQNYVDQGLRIESVFNINIIDDQVVTSIEGVYVNFGYAFTIQKSVQDIGDTSIAWRVKWAEDSIPSTTSFYEHLVNVFKDSHDTIWASVSGSGNEIHNNIYTGSLSADIPWNINMDIITEQSGRFLFSEAANGRLYTASYFTGDQIFVRSISTNTSVPGSENKQFGGWKIYPNPADKYILLLNSSNSISENVNLTLYDMLGKKLMENKIQHRNEVVIPLEDKLISTGIYFLSINDGRAHQILKIIKY